LTWMRSVAGPPQIFAGVIKTQIAQVYLRFLAAQPHAGLAKIEGASRLISLRHVVLRNLTS